MNSKRLTIAHIFGLAAAFVAVPGVSLGAPTPAPTLTVVTSEFLQITVPDGSPVRETLAGKGEDGRIDRIEVDLKAAARTASFRVASQDDARFGTGGVSPSAVGRKSKGRNFVNNHGTYAWVTDHFLYLRLPYPLLRGRHYRVEMTGVVTKPFATEVIFVESQVHSAAIHVNTIGYAPRAPEKFAYLSHWMGDLGPLGLDDRHGPAFHVVERSTGKSYFDGAVRLRKRLTEAESGQGEIDGRNGNLTSADVWECDFSGLKRPGEYVIAVDGIGSSLPFRVDSDVYRKLFRVTARGLYHQRCGIELKQPYTEWVRDACHRPEMRPFLTTTDNYLITPHHDGDPNAASKTTGERRLVWGGWHDAGDWDRESWHLEAADTLLIGYALAPGKYHDGDLNIPESGNGIPDILDEAAFDIDYYRRIQRPDGGVSVGFYESSYPKPGMTSVKDPMGWYIYAEDAAQTYRYAGSASRLAWCLREAGKPELAKGYIASARRAWSWAWSHEPADPKVSVRDERASAAAGLFRATGEKAFEEAFARDCQVSTPTSALLWWEHYDQRFAVWTLIIGAIPGQDMALRNRLTGAAIHWADTEFVETAKKRSPRNGYPWYNPLSWSADTVPQTLGLMVAHRLTGEDRFLAPQYTASDFCLGGNPRDMTWVTGMGPIHPHDVMQWDSWYHPLFYRTGESVPGIVPMGPTHYIPGKAVGNWDAGWAQQNCLYPEARLWPTHELWLENRYTPATNEFTVGQIATAAVAYGYLQADASKAGP